MYDDPERAIFAYHDGEAPRRGDPLALEAAYTESLAGEDRAGLEEQLRSPHPAARRAAGERLLPAIRAAFGVSELDEDTGRGLATSATFDLTRRLFAWKAATRARYRTLAHHVAVYGHDSGRPLGYEAFCGLWYNAGRVEALQAVQVARGIVAAMTGRPHPSMVDALAESESGVPWVQLQVDAERAEAEQAAKMAEGRLL